MSSIKSHHGAQGAAARGRGPGLHPGVHDLLHGVEARVNWAMATVKPILPDLLNSVASPGTGDGG